MGKIKEVLRNKWFKFTLVSIIYILLCVVWTGNLWMLLGLVVIYDIYISKYLYKWIWKSHKERKKKSRSYKVASEWVEAIVFAIVVVTLIRIFIFAMYVIPSSSMEKSLLTGDYLVVSKLAYGPAVPNTPISFPLVHNTMPFSTTRRSYLEWPNWRYHRLKGLGDIERGDVVVFNFPAGDTVILELQNRTYYDVVRDEQAIYGERDGYRRIHENSTVISRPVDRRENYVKRCVGIPGDIIEIVDSEASVNGEPFTDNPEIQYAYVIYTNGQPIANKRLDEMGISQEDRARAYRSQEKAYILPLTTANLGIVSKMPNVVSVQRIIHQADLDTRDHNIFPHDTAYVWTQDNFGPLWIPKKGETAKLDASTLPLYREIIEKYEGPNKVEERDGSVFINGMQTDSYTFKMDYYFMMGDNRHNSADSRFWGFVPEDHIVGKASFIWLSIDRDKALLSGIRWSRMFRRVK